MPQTDFNTYLLIIQAATSPSPHGLGFRLERVEFIGFGLWVLSFSVSMRVWGGYKRIVAPSSIFDWGITAKNPNCTCSASKFSYWGPNYLLFMYWDARKKLISSEPRKALQGVRLRVEYELLVPQI